MSASGNHKTGTRGGLFPSILFLNSLIHAATPPPFWFIQGDSISILVPSLALPINSSLPCVGPPSVPLYSIKFIRMGRLVLLICILNPREARDQGRMKPFAGETGRLQGIRADIMYFCTPSIRCSCMTPGHQYVIFISIF